MGIEGASNSVNPARFDDIEPNKQQPKPTSPTSTKGRVSSVEGQPIVGKNANNGDAKKSGSGVDDKFIGQRHVAARRQILKSIPSPLTRRHAMRAAGETAQQVTTEHVYKPLQFDTTQNSQRVPTNPESVDTQKADEATPKDKTKALIGQIDKAIKRTDEIAKKIQDLEIKDSGSSYIPTQNINYPELKKQYEQAHIKLKAAFKKLKKNPQDIKIKKDVANNALRTQLLYRKITKDNCPTEITESLPENPASKHKQLGNATKSAPKVNLSLRDKFNEALLGFSSIISTVYFQLENIHTEIAGPEETTKSRLDILIATDSADSLKKNIFKGKFPNEGFKTDSLRKVTTKINSLSDCLDIGDKQRLEKLSRGDEAKIDGIDFLDYATTETEYKTHIIKPETIEKLQEHLLKLDKFVEEINKKYGLDPGYS